MIDECPSLPLIHFSTAVVGSLSIFKNKRGRHFSQANLDYFTHPPAKEKPSQCISDRWLKAWMARPVAKSCG
jgi:hypothetical protein